MSYKRRICVRGIIYKNSKLLCQQLKATHTNNDVSTFWCTPGGGVEDGESIHQALVREMIEETGVSPDIGRLLFVQQFFDGTKEQLEFFFHIKNADDYEHIDLSATSHGDIEIAACEFIDPRSSHILPEFLQSTDIEGFITNNQPVAFYFER